MNHRLPLLVIVMLLSMPTISFGAFPWSKPKVEEYKEDDTPRCNYPWLNKIGDVLAYPGKTIMHTSPHDVLRLTLSRLCPCVFNDELAYENRWRYVPVTALAAAAVIYGATRPPVRNKAKSCAYAIAKKVGLRS